MIEFINTEKKNKNIVLFVHGFTGGKETWVNENSNSFPDMLLEHEEIKKNFDFAYVCYYTKLIDSKIIKNGKFLLKKFILKRNSKLEKNIDIKDLSECLQSAIKYKCEEYENIVIIAHSMGGLISKAYILDQIKEKNESKVKLFISLAVPHKGSDWANIGNALSSFLKAENRQILDLEPLSGTLEKLNADWIFQNNIPKTIYFQGKYDEVVPMNSSIGYETKKPDIVYCDDGHISISKPKSEKEISFIAVKKELLNFIKYENEKNIEVLTKNDSDSLNIQFNNDIRRIANGVKVDTNSQVFFDKSKNESMIESMKNIDLEWPLKLERVGIMAENMKFTEKEKNITEDKNYTINNFYGNVSNSQIQQNSNSSTQNMCNESIDKQEVINTLNIIKDNLDKIKLDYEKKSEINSQVKTIETQLESKKPKKSIISECFKMIRSVLEGATGNIIASGIIHQIDLYINGPLK